jgi:hypothetical protein
VFWRWHAAILRGLAEGDELADGQHLGPDGRRRLQESFLVVGRVEQLLADLPAAPGLVATNPSELARALWSSRLCKSSAQPEYLKRVTNTAQGLAHFPVNPVPDDCAARSRG